MDRNLLKENITEAFKIALKEFTAQGVLKAAEKRGERDIYDEDGNTIDVNSKANDGRVTILTKDSKTGGVVVDRYDKTNKPPRATMDKLAKGKKLTPAEQATAERRRNRSVSDPKNRRTILPQQNKTKFKEQIKNAVLNYLDEENRFPGDKRDTVKTGKKVGSIEGSDPSYQTPENRARGDKIIMNASGGDQKAEAAGRRARRTASGFIPGPTGTPPAEHPSVTKLKRNFNSSRKSRR
jgi:hypothetical protein